MIQEDVYARLSALEHGFAMLAARLDAIAPPPVAPRSDLDDFTRPKLVQWPFAWHGRPDDRPASLPVPTVLDRREAIMRARWGYSPDGRRVKVGTEFDKVWKAVEAIRTAFSPGSVPAAVVRPILTRFEGVDPVFACFGTLLGLWAPTPAEELEGQQKPSDFAGMTIESYLKPFLETPASPDEP
jgi:hypothetical protein